MSTTSRNTENLHADIAVIGCGGAGLSAALAAAEAGVKDIILLEKAAAPGGNTLSVGCIFAVDSPAQKRLGINVSADQVLREKMAQANWKINPRLIRACIDKSGRIIEWLEKKGIEFKEIIVFRPEADSPRVSHDLKPGHPGFTGKTVIETLSRECRDRGIRLLCGTAAKKIMIDEKGEVNAVLASTDDREYKIAVKSVIIAAGGFGRNREMLSRYFPLLHGDIFTYSPPQMTGDGLSMASEIGAVIHDQLSVLTVGPEYKGSKNLDIILRQPDVMLVNKNGERYFDESVHLYSIMDVVSNTLGRQPDNMCCALLDSETLREISRKRITMHNFEKDIAKDEAGADELENSLQRDASAGTAKISGSLNEIALWLGADPSVLKAEVERYNSFCDQGYDRDFLKDKKFLRPLRMPPFYALRGRQVINTTFGGIMINHRTEVINKENGIIKGLYAAGDNAGSWAAADYSHRYPGSAASFAFCSGFISGESAAEYVLGKA